MRPISSELIYLRKYSAARKRYPPQYIIYGNYPLTPPILVGIIRLGVSLPWDFASRKLGLSFVGHGTYFGVTGTELSGQVGNTPSAYPYTCFLGIVT